MNSYNRIYPSNQTELTFDKYNFSRALCWGGGGRLISKGHILYDLIYFLIGVCCCYLVASVMSDSFATPCTAARQASLSMGFSRQEYWSGLPFPSPKAELSSVQFSSGHSVVSDSLRPHESQHTRPPGPSPTPEVHSDSRPSSR